MQRFAMFLVYSNKSCNGKVQKAMYENGQPLSDDKQFKDHIGRDIPIQVYSSNAHHDIGFVKEISPDFVKVNNTFYRRDRYVFVSRPGY